MSTVPIEVIYNHLGDPGEHQSLLLVRYGTLTIEINDPPIQALDPTCKNTILTWLRQGAQPVGGTDCDRDLSCEGCPNFP